MERHDRKKALCTIPLALFFFWMLYSTWVKPSEVRNETFADELALRTITIEICALDANSSLDPVARLAKLRRLAVRLHAEALKDPADTTLQIRDWILRYEAGFPGSPTGMDLLKKRPVETGERGEFRLLEQIYHGPALTEAEQRIWRDRVGDDWYGLTALLHSAELHHDQDRIQLLKGERSKWARAVVSRISGLSLFVGFVVLIGTFLWLRFLVHLRRRPGAPTERLLSLAHWNWLDGVFGFLFFFFLLTVLSVTLEPFAGRMEQWGFSEGFEVFLLYVIQSIVGLFLIWRFFFRKEGQGIAAACRTMGFPLGGGKITRTLSWGVGGYAASMPLVLVLLYLSSIVFHQQPVTGNPLLPMLTEASSPAERLLFFVTISVLAPLFEEIFFRGFPFNSFRARLGTVAGTVLSAFLFAVIHFDFAVFLGLFAIGIMLSVVYYRTQSLAAPILLHCFWNTTTLITVQLLLSGP
jgi:membrane protease YdiL (CAAX protease family)